MGDRLKGKVALLSAAGAGIGQAVARRFAEEGAHLWVNDLDPAKVERLVGELDGRHGPVGGSAGDVSDLSYVQNWVEAGIAEYHRVDILYNNAAQVGDDLAFVADITDAQYRRQQSVTLDSVFYATRAVLPHMVRQGSGSIVSMSSAAGIGGGYGRGAYGAAKAAVINLMETVAMEYGHLGIRANAATPGLTATDSMRAAVARHPGGEDAMTTHLILSRASRPEEVANLVLFLASDESSNITGICVRSNIPSKGNRG